jgi:aromatic-L-amino-acid/L-tryptophan decarboxylase
MDNDHHPPERLTRPLDPTGSRLRELLAQAVDYVASTVDRLPGSPASDLTDIHPMLADPRIRAAPPRDGRPLAELLDVLDHAAGKGMNLPSPGFMAFTPGGGLVTAAIADLIADVLNRPTGVAFPAPALVAMETDVLRWTADLFGMPDSTMGTLTTGASIATLSAVITARHARLTGDFRRGTAYVSDQAHPCIAKALRLAGFPGDAVRTVPSDADQRMDVRALEMAVDADRAVGLRPFLVVGTAGTTNTGAVDPLSSIADVAVRERLWFHVDAAYGGYFQLTRRGRDRLHGADRADSLVIDPHKGLFLPFGTGCLLVRQGELLRRAHSADSAAYRQDLRDTGLADFADYSIELSRDFRGLRIWLPLHLHGVEAFRSALDEMLDLAALLHAELSHDPRLAVTGRPQLSTVTFRCRVADPDAADAATRELVRRVNDEGRVYLSSTWVDGRYAGRVCILNHRIDRDRVAEAAAAIRRHADDIVKASAAGRR